MKIDKKSAIAFHAFIVLMVLLVGIFWALDDKADKRAALATATVWPPPTSQSGFETFVANVEAAGLRHPGWIYDGELYRNVDCGCGTDGQYIGAVPCDFSKIAITSDENAVEIIANQWCGDMGYAVLQSDAGIEIRDINSGDLGWLQYQGQTYRNALCACGDDVGVIPCNDSLVGIVTYGAVATVDPNVIPECGGMGYAYPFKEVGYDIVTVTPEPTVTPLPIPLQCVKIVWDKGLNMRYGPSMSGSPTSYLDEGFVFVPLDVVNGYDIFGKYIGIAVKVAQPNWYIFMNLTYRPNDTYAIFVECQ